VDFHDDACAPTISGCLRVAWLADAVGSEASRPNGGARLQQLFRGWRHTRVAEDPFLVQLSCNALTFLWPSAVWIAAGSQCDLGFGGIGELIELPSRVDATRAAI
jgi:hypothetical protein